MSFPKAFSSVPTVVATPSNSYFTVDVGSVTVNGFEGSATNWTSATRYLHSIHWIATA